MTDDTNRIVGNSYFSAPNHNTIVSQAEQISKLESQVKTLTEARDKWRERVQLNDPLPSGAGGIRCERGIDGGAPAIFEFGDIMTVAHIRQSILNELRGRTVPALQSAVEQARTPIYDDPDTHGADAMAYAINAGDFKRDYQAEVAKAERPVTFPFLWPAESITDESGHGVGAGVSDFAAEVVAEYEAAKIPSAIEARLEKIEADADGVRSSLKELWRMFTESFRMSKT